MDLRTILIKTIAGHMMIKYALCGDAYKEKEEQFIKELDGKSDEYLVEALVEEVRKIPRIRMK
jgi:hypothetical protein